MPRRTIGPAQAAIPNLAPMVDVVMVILIFFMLGTSFAIPEGVLPTRLPSQIGPGGGARVAIIPVVRIALLDDGQTGRSRILVMGSSLPENSFAALADLMRAKRRASGDSSAPVLIAADPNVQYQDVISTMDACVRAGFGNIQFSVSTTAIQAGFDEGGAT